MNYEINEVDKSNHCITRKQNGLNIMTLVFLKINPNKKTLHVGLTIDNTEYSIIIIL